MLNPKILWPLRSLAPRLSLGPLHTALRVMGTVITVEDLQSCFRDVRPLGKVTEACRISLLLLTYVLPVHVCEA